MGQITKLYRLRIATVSATNVEGSIAYTFQSQIGSIPVIGGQIVRPSEGKTESKPWSIDIVDVASVFTNTLSNTSTGRPWLLGRLADVQVSLDNGTSWTTQATGRIADVFQQEPGLYTVHIEDERWVERNTDAFTNVTNGCTLYPPGTKYPWRGMSPVVLDSDTKNRHLEQVGTDGNFRKVRFLALMPLSDSIVDIIKGDLVDKPQRRSTTGAFKNLKCHIDGTDYPIVTFDELDNESFVDKLYSFRPMQDMGRYNSKLECWVYAPTGLGTPSYRGVYYVGYIHAPTAPLSDALPFHTGTEYVGETPYRTYSTTDPFKLVKELYDAAGVRYDTTIFSDWNASTNPNGLINNPLFPAMSFRVTQTMKLDEWLEEHIYNPLGVVPFVNSDGKIAPRIIHLLQNVDPSTLFEFNSTNLTEHPTFEHTSQELVNSIEFSYESYRAMWWNPYIYQSHSDRAPNGNDFPADLIIGSEKTIKKTHDNTSVKKEPLRMNLSGVPSLDSIVSIGSWVRLLGKKYPSSVMGTIEGMAEFIAKEMFERFGDGPIKGRLLGNSNTSTVNAGDYVRLNLSSYPDVATATRGGSVRVVQIVSKTIHPDHYEFEYLDAGASLQPLAAPTITGTVANTANPKHAVDVTIGSVPAGATVELQISRGDSTSAAKWETARAGIAAGTYTITGLPSNTKIWFRVRATAPNRIRSAWSIATSLTTQAITAPVIVSSSAVATSLKVGWTVGDANYPVMVRIGKNPATPQDAIDRPLPAGSTTFMFDELEASSNYTIYVLHVDAYGGESAVASTGTVASSAASTLSAPTRLAVQQGRAATNTPLPEEEAIIGYGLEVSIRPADSSSRIEVQVATDSGFTANLITLNLSPGASRAFIQLNKLDEQVRYARARHTRLGFTSSSWTSTVSAYPTALIANSGPDLFAGGYAYLSVESTGVIKLNVGVDNDTDTERFYYEVARNASSYPNVTLSSPYITRSQLPYFATITIGPSANILNDEVKLSGKFWNAIVGFGSEVRHSIGNPTSVVNGVESQVGLSCTNNMLQITLNSIDPNADWWQAWGKLGGWPTIDGTNSNSAFPDPTKLICDYPTTLTSPSAFYVPNGTYYVAVRSYEKNTGSAGPLYFASIVISSGGGGGGGGGAPGGTGGQVSLLDVTISTNNHKFSWTNNAAIEAGGYTVDITVSVNGAPAVSLATGRNPLLDGAANTVANKGHIDNVVTSCAKGSAGCVYNNYVYTIKLYEGATLRQTAQISIYDYTVDL